MPLAARSQKTRLSAVLALSALAAGCSLNPFGQKNDEPVPVSQPGQSATQPVSIAEPRRRPVSNAPTVSQMDTVPLAANAPDQYVVKRGDTLWDISGKFLTDPWYWPEIWQANPQIENPHLIYPGDLLSLVYIDGQPRLLLQRGGGVARMSPGVRVIPLEEAITTIPYEAISAFLSRAAVLEKDELEGLPYILQARGDHLISSAGVDLYARGDLKGIGRRYSIVHPEGALVDPDNGDVVGYEALYVGDGTIRREGDPATLFVNQSQREILNGDRLIDQDIVIPLNFFPKPPSQTIDGRIISVIDGVSRIGQYQVVVINRGERDGLVSGDTLDILRAGDVVRDRYTKNSFLGSERVKLPDEEAGTLMLFKIYDRIAYGLIMKAESEIQTGDLVRSPQ